MANNKDDKDIFLRDIVNVSNSSYTTVRDNVIALKPVIKKLGWKWEKRISERKNGIVRVKQ